MSVTMLDGTCNIWAYVVTSGPVVSNVFSVVYITLGHDKNPGVAVACVR